MNKILGAVIALDYSLFMPSVSELNVYNNLNEETGIIVFLFCLFA